MADPKITARVEHLQRWKERSLVAAALTDKEKVLAKLRDMLDNANTESVQLRAAELLGKSVGLFKDVQVQEAPQRSSEELRAKLDELLEQCGLKLVPDDLVH